MNYRLFYTIHLLCGSLAVLQVVFFKTRIPFHFFACVLAGLAIWRLHQCRFARLEFLLGLMLLYVFRLFLLFWFTSLHFIWYVYHFFLLMMALLLLLVGMRLFIC